MTPDGGDGHGFPVGFFFVLSLGTRKSADHGGNHKAELSGRALVPAIEAGARAPFSILSSIHRGDEKIVKIGGFPVSLVALSQMALIFFLRRCGARGAYVGIVNLGLKSGSRTILSPSRSASAFESFGVIKYRVTAQAALVRYMEKMYEQTCASRLSFY